MVCSRTRGLFLHSLVLMCCLNGASAAPLDPFTIVVMPDTQKYVQLGRGGLENQTHWIRTNLEALNCKFVVHVGDIVENPAKESEWQLATKAFEYLDGAVPYAFSVGNHDMVVSKRDKGLYHKYFPLERFTNMPTYGGCQDAQADNTYHLLTVGHLKFLILSIDYQPGSATLAWANNTVQAYPDRQVIVNTHSYLVVNERNGDGKRIWDKFVRKHANIFLVLCGHLSVGRRVARGDHGNTVHEILANYQGLDNGGNGWLRQMRFVPRENRIEVSTYSTLFKREMQQGDPRWSRLADNHFHIPFPMDANSKAQPLAAVPVTEAPSLQAVVQSVHKIWDKAPHNAFTDLAQFRGKLYCAFREGRGHAGDVGKIRVLVSDDAGQQWQSAAQIEWEGNDLRDAKLSVMPNGQLMLCGGAQTTVNRQAITQTFACISADGKTWTKPSMITDRGRWMWGVTWHQGKAYGVSYPAPNGGPSSSLLVSDHGERFTPLVRNFRMSERPTEAVIRFGNDGQCVCLHRRDGNPGRAQFGQAPAPNGPWRWTTLDRKIGGPSLIQHANGDWIAVVRLYEGGTRTEVCHIDPETGTLTPLCRLPSGGDTSYPGLQWREGNLLVSYYSSHTGKATIYLAEIAFHVGR